MWGDWKLPLKLMKCKIVKNNVGRIENAKPNAGH